MQWPSDAVHGGIARRHAPGRAQPRRGAEAAQHGGADGGGVEPAEPDRGAHGAAGGGGCGAASRRPGRRPVRYSLLDTVGVFSCIRRRLCRLSGRAENLPVLRYRQESVQGSEPSSSASSVRGDRSPSRLSAEPSSLASAGQKPPTARELADDGVRPRRLPDHVASNLASWTPQVVPPPPPPVATLPLSPPITSKGPTSKAAPPNSCYDTVASCVLPGVW